MTLTALITGATSGIGLATARTFARNGVRLILCGRRKERLDALAQELGAWVQVHTLSFDVRHADDVAAKIASLPEDFCSIDILVNNAGNAHGLAPIQDGDITDWDAMIDINVKGLLYVSKAVIPQMIERKRGHIINIGSLAGQEVYPNGNVYCASKFAVDALTKGMRIDLNPHNIKVTSINPGLVETEFSLVRFKGDAERAKNVYKGMTPLTAEDVAEVIWFAASRLAHVNVAELLLLPTAQATSAIVKREG
jgi:NADP-dependent 3-hydroxy acid dehydrogenase YdfG